MSDAIIEAIDRAIDLLQSKVKSREQALAITKLEEGKMWYLELLKRKK